MPSSSSHRPSAPPSAPAQPSVSTTAFIDWGPALPESYGRPRVLALVRDPQCFFACWEGGDGIRARDLTDGSLQEQGVGRIGSWYFQGTPEHEYVVELTAGGRVAATSARLRLPRLHPATETDPEWTPDESQAEVLRQFVGTLEPVVHEVEVPGSSKGWRRRIAGLPVSRPSRTS